MLTQSQISQEFERRRTHFQEYLRSPDYAEQIVQRLKLQDAGNRNAKARAYIHYLCQRPENPAEGCIFFIENFCWSFDPRPEHAPHHLPFILFDYQKDAIRWMIDHIDNGKDGLIEKSRDMGASWLFFVVIPIWYWLFRDGVNILIGSYKEALVDNRADDSLFGKIDYVIRSLPNWMLPKKFNFEKHRTKLKLTNPENFNQIIGDTMNPLFGRGTRKTVVLFDELGFWDYAKDAWEGTGDATSCRIANSTPHGYNYYSMLRDSGIDVVTLHWKQHPLKDQQWYEFECARRTEEEVAQELDISYEKSREGRVYEEWPHYLTKGVFDYDPTLPMYVAWDFGKCVSEDTEALTPFGWKHHSELSDGDLIYTLNPESGLGEWQSIRGKLVLGHKGDVTSVSSRGFKTKFTDGHKWPVKRNGVYELDVWDNITSYEHMVTSALCGSLPETPLFSDSFVELMAWFWTEGYINGKGVEISQAKSENFDRIRSCIKETFDQKFWSEREPRLRKNTNLPLIRWYIHGIAAQSLTRWADYRKVVSYDFINKLTKEQLELFVEVSLLADGHKNLLKQSIPERVDIFAYANLLLGRKVNYGVEKMKCYGDYRYVTVYEKNKTLPYNHNRWGRVKREKYLGTVWCPTVSNHIWLARSQGTVYFTGNSDDTAIIWAQPDPKGGIRIIDVYRNTGKNIDFYVPFVTGVTPSEGYKYKKEDLDVIEKHREWRRGTHFGDPAGRFTNQVVDQSVIDVLRDYGIIINFAERWKYHSTRKSATKRLIMDGVKLNDNGDRTKYFDMCIANAAYPKIRVEGVETFNKTKPKHDDTSHYRSALEYLALGLEDYKPRVARPHDKFPKREEIIGRKQIRRSVGY